MQRRKPHSLPPTGALPALRDPWQLRLHKTPCYKSYSVPRVLAWAAAGRRGGCRLACTRPARELARKLSRTHMGPPCAIEDRLSRSAHDLDLSLIIIILLITQLRVDEDTALDTCETGAAQPATSRPHPWAPAQHASHSARHAWHRRARSARSLRAPPMRAAPARPPACTLARQHVCACAPA